MGHLGLVLAMVTIAVIGMVFSLLAALNKSKGGSGLDLIWRRGIGRSSGWNCIGRASTSREEDGTCMRTTSLE